MEKFKKYLRWALGALLLVLGIIGLVELALEGYDPNNADILVYSEGFKDLFNALMLSYVGVLIRICHIVIGFILLTKKYWWIGLLLHLPIAVNIFLTHILYDIPTDQKVFFGVGMFVSLSTFILVACEKEKLKNLVIT